MSRGCFALASLLAACGYGQDGDLCPDLFCPPPVDVVVTGPMDPPRPGTPLALTVDGVVLSTVAMPRGGVVHVQVTGQTQPLSFGPGSPAFDVVVGPSTLDVVAREVGDGVLRVHAGTSVVELAVQVRELGSIGLSLEGEPPRDRLAVMADITSATLELSSSAGEPLRDHSLVVEPGSEGFSASGTAIGLPSTPGDHVLVLGRATGERYPIDVRVADHLDDIVVDRFDAQQVTGSLCVHGELAGERVDTRTFQFSGSAGLIITPATTGCVGFAAASPGSSITVERAGATRQVVFP